MLLKGGAIEKYIHENIAFPELYEDKDTLWSLLVFSGYLRATKKNGHVEATVKIFR